MREGEGVLRLSWTMLLAVTACLLIMLLLATNVVGRQVTQLRMQVQHAEHRSVSHQGMLARTGNPHLDEAAADLWISTTPGATRFARFQERVSGLLRTHGADLVELRLVAPEPGDHPTRLRLGVSFRTMPSQLEGTLAALETSRPLMLIDMFDLRTGEQQGSADPGRNPDILFLMMELTAYAPLGSSS